MRGCQFSRSERGRTGYQRHHLIPVEVICKPALSPAVNVLRTVGFNPQDFATNGLWLPASERIASQTGLPLHRGPHPHYNEFVGDQVAFLYRNLIISTKEGLVALRTRLHHLQGNLWRSLSRADSGLWLNRHDPREDLGFFATFDNDLRQLSMAEFLF